ncbi:glycosidase [Paucihalobacter sp.]|uniref:glycosidase n=1 Tax=Paucihalobacter sp. TaxID=2850405 RepID=UPI002FDFD474
MKIDGNKQNLKGVMLNAYPDSIGQKLSDVIQMLQFPEFKDTFSVFYILPTFFNSDLDRGFSIIDYKLNKDLVSTADLDELSELNIQLKFDIVLNHLSVASPQFKDLLEHGDESKYKNFFINWNSFWKDYGALNQDDVIIPKQEFLDKLFMRKSGLPILNVPFPNGSKQPYWNTFYQQVNYNEIAISDINGVDNLDDLKIEEIVNKVNKAINQGVDLKSIDFNLDQLIVNQILNIVDEKCTYLGQMDLNAESPMVWDFYEETLLKLHEYGCKILRLDAFAYLHKEIGQSNFFNKPGTWIYLERLEAIANKYNLILLPEIHAEYGLGLHHELASQGYHIYDFFLPGLVIHSLESGNNSAFLKWINEINTKNYKTINMLGCHDGIPILDLKGKEINGTLHDGLLDDEEVETVIQIILARGGRIKNLYDSTGKKISYYQINATFFSALGENERKLLLARALQLFTPGIPQIWYLDIFAGKNNYQAIEKAGSGGHKEINRTSINLEDIPYLLQKDIVKNQIKLINFRNNSKAFLGTLKINPSKKHEVDLEWNHEGHFARLIANLKTCNFEISYNDSDFSGQMSF